MDSLTKHFKSLGTEPNLSSPRKEHPLAEDNTDIKKGQFTSEVPDSSISLITNTEGTFTATPIFISKSSVNTIHIVKSGQYKQEGSDSSGSCQQRHPTRRKRCPDVPASNKYGKRDKKSSTTDIPQKETPISLKSVSLANQLPVSEVEMSIESVEKALDETQIEAFATTEDMESSSGDNAREVTRTSSSLSSKFEHQECATESLRPKSPLRTISSPASVPRSYSDISCRLEGQHSRDSSIVSSHSRLSRASAGADLESFFNQMGLEKGVLDPISRLNKLQSCDVFDSVSSLESHDAASICSAYSRSEKEWSDLQAVEVMQHPTSVVERNARIIKWLCNVRKAKTVKQEAKTSGNI